MNLSLPARAVACALLLATAAAVPPAHGTETAEAVLSQQTLPGLQARRSAAEARVGAAEAWFAGRTTLGGAFPDLDGAPLGSPSLLDGQLRQLDAAGASRAAARVAPPPDGLSGRALLRWQAAQQATLDAEERADELRRRFLLGLRGGLARAPGLGLARTEGEVLASWREVAAAEPPAGASPEEAAAVVARAAAAGSAIAAQERYAEAAWRAMTIAGDGRLAELVDQDLAAVPPWTSDPAQEVLALAWADRLARVAPLLDAQRQAAIAAARSQLELAQLEARLPELQAELDALAARLAAPVQLDPAATEEALQATLEVATARRGEIQAAAPGPVDPEASDLARLRAQTWALEQAVAQAELDLASRRLDTWRTRADALAAAAQQAAVDEARRRADESIARVEASTTEQEADFRKQLAQLQVEVAEGLDQEARRHRDTMLGLQELEQRWRQAARDAHEAIAMAPLAVGREGRIDSAWRDLRAVVADLRAAVAARRDHLSTVRTSSGELGRRLPDAGGLPPAVQQDVGPELSGLEGDIHSLDARRRDNATEELDGALTLLAMAKVDRREVRPHASARARDDVLESFVPELRQEALEAPAVVSAELRRTAAAVRALPGQLFDLNVILAFMARSFEIVLLGIAWLALRRNGEVWAGRLLDLLARQRAEQESEGTTRRHLLVGWFVDGDLRSLAAPLAPVLFAAADIGVSYGLYRLAYDSLTPLALLLLLWVARSIYKGGPNLVSLIWATPDEVRPALAIVSEETLERGRQSLRVVLLAVLSVAVLRFVAIALFDADRFADLVNTARVFIYLVVLVWLLTTWAETIRMKVASTGDTAKAVAWLSREDSSPVLRVVRAAGGLLYLAWRGSTELLVRVAEGRPGLGWLASALARARLRGTSEGVVEAVEVDGSVLGELDQASFAVPRARQLEALREAMAAWGEERRRGMIAVVGHRGSGKSHLLDAAEHLAGELLPDLPVTRIALTQRISDPAAALIWMAQVTGASFDDTPADESEIEALGEAVAALPTSVFLVDDLHRLVLRAVGGFAAARAVLRVMLAASEEHFWICAFHRPTWNYLAGVGSSINLDAFRAEIDLGPLPAARLGEWVRGRVDQAGYSVGFDGLIAGTPVGLDAQRARERAEQAYWRLLSDASMGIPDVAWGYFRSGLCVGRGIRTLDVRMFDAPASTDLESLPDLDLFVLTAVVIHDELESAAIGNVLNAPTAQVQEACRHLESIGVLEGHRSGRSWAISARWRPAVQRILRQKHFLYMR